MRRKDNNLKKSGYTRGRWAVERERCHLDMARPPARVEDGHSISESLGLLVDRLGLKEPGWSAQCEEEWDTLVGASVAQHTRPGKLMGSKLVVFVDTSVWFSELSRNGKITMLKRLQARFGKERVSMIILRLEPGR